MKSFALDKSNRLIYLLLAGAIVAYSLYFALFQLDMHRALWTGVDLTNMEQTIWNTLHGNFMRSTVYPPTGEYITEFTDRATESRLATHVQPLQLVLAIPYLFFPRTETLLILVSVAVGLGALPAFRLARRRLDSPWVALVCALLYLLLPAVQTQSAWDIHGTSFLPPLMLAALDAAERSKRGEWWLWALLAMSCREDLPFLVGWGMLWLAPPERRREAKVMAGVGLVFSLLNFFVIIPHFSGGSGTPYLARFFPPGTEISLAALLQPEYWRLQALHFLEYNLRLGLPLLFLFWLDWRVLLASAPMLALNSFTWYQAARLPFFSHYSAPIVAWIWVGALQGLRIAARNLSRRRPRLHWRGLLLEALVVSVMAVNVLEGYLPFSRIFVWPEPLRPQAAVTELLTIVPDEAPLAAGLHLAPHLSQRPTLRFFPDMRDAEWVALDLWFWDDPYGVGVEIWQQLLVDPLWETAATRDGMLILRKGQGPPTALAAALAPTAEIPLAPLDVTFAGGETRLLGMRLFPLPLGHFILCTDWSGWGEAGVPQVQIGEAEGNFSAPMHLNTTWMLPNMTVSTPVRDCTQFAVPVGSRELQLRLALLTPDAAAVTVQIEDAGEWNSRLWLEDSALRLRLPVR